jgi:polysaccharide biosynthesis protein PslH
MESNWFSSDECDVRVAGKYGEHLLGDVITNSATGEDLTINTNIRSFNSDLANRCTQPNRLFTICTSSLPSYSEGLLWWLRKGYKYLHSICLDVSFDIIGMHSPLSVQKVVSQYAGVTLHNSTTNEEYFWTRASALLVPVLRTEALQLKILKAMVLGVPVISTTVGCKGLAVNSGEHLLVADEPETLALACAIVLRDKKLALYLARNAYQLMLDRYGAKVE